MTHHLAKHLAHNMLGTHLVGADNTDIRSGRTNAVKIGLDFVACSPGRAFFRS